MANVRTAKDGRETKVVKLSPPPAFALQKKARGIYSRILSRRYEVVKEPPVSGRAYLPKAPHHTQGLFIPSIKLIVPDHMGTFAGRTSGICNLNFEPGVAPHINLKSGNSI